MLSLPGYNAVELLTEDEQTHAYLAERGDDRQRVIVTVPRSAAIASLVRDRFRREHDLLSSIACAGVPRAVTLIEHAGLPALVHTDPGGRLLANLLQGRPCSLDGFWSIAIGLVDTVAALHACGVMHHDIHTRHVMVGCDGSVSLLGFGLASRLVREFPLPLPLAHFEGSLAHLSPERTGRMNRWVDDRSDLYAIGVTLHEALTGEPPFVAHDPVELMNAHLATRPRALSEWAPGVPKVLSDIVLKLLSKFAEDRYPSAASLLADLRRCRAEWAAGAAIAPFELGVQAAVAAFVPSQKLYGRDRAVAALTGAFERVANSGRAEVMLVTGRSGIGKSALVAELHRPVAARRGWFVAGKFDRYQRDACSTLSHSFHVLVDELLMQDETSLNHWRQRLQAALGDQGAALTALIPKLVLIIGPQPLLPELSPERAEHRLRRVFQRFIALFATRERPLVILLDDLQWADVGSLALLEHLFSDAPQQHLLLVGTCRKAAEPGVAAMLSALRLQGVPNQTLLLEPLTEPEVGELVSHSLREGGHPIDALAHLIHKATRGNPLYSVQLLTALHREGAIAFDATARRWTADAVTLAARRFPDSAAGLLGAQFARFGGETRSVLLIAALLGQPVDEAQLARAADRGVHRLEQALWPALQAGWMAHDRGGYRFLHDAFRESARAALPAHRLAELHLRIARTLFAAEGDSALRRVGDAHAFELANHFNFATTELTEVGERLVAARLNQRAAEKAIASNCHAAARGYLSAGRALLPADAWQAEPALAFALARDHARLACSSHEFGTVDATCGEALAQQLDTVDRAEIERIRIESQLRRGATAAAFEIATAALQRLGITLAHDAAQLDGQAQEVWRLLGDRDIESLAEQPPCRDAERQAAFDLLAAIAPASHSVDTLWAGAVACQMMLICLRHGNAIGCASAYAQFGALCCIREGRAEAGFRFGQLAAEMVERQRWLAGKAQVHFCIAHFISPHTQPYAESLSQLGICVAVARDIGDENAHHVALSVSTCLLLLGRPLAQVADTLADRPEHAWREPVLDMFASLRALVANLRGQTRRFGSFDGAEFDAPAFEQRVEAEGVPQAIGWYHVSKLQAAYLAGEFDVAQASVDMLLRWLPRLSGRLIVPDLHFFGALTLAARIDTLPPARRRAALEELRAHHERLRRRARDNPHTFDAMVALVTAELARVEGDALYAQAQYERAQEVARRHGFVQHLALALELAAKHHRQRGLMSIAAFQLRGACDAYLRWGALGKVIALTAQHPWLAQPVEPARAGATSLEVAGAETTAIVHAARAISGHLVREDLLGELMQRVLQRSGAQFGALLLEAGGAQHLAASALAGEGGVRVRVEAMQPVSPQDLPLSVLNHVRRTRETVQLDDARRPHPYSADPCLSSGRARALLAVPVQRRATLLGVLYFEQRQGARAFGAAQVAGLELLAAQAAVSLDNAQLYAQLEAHQRALESKVAARTAELAHSRSVLQTILDGSPAMISLKDLDGRYLLYNRRFAEFAGRGVESLLGLHAEDVNGPELGAMLNEQDREVIAANCGLTFEFASAFGGAPRAFEAHKFPVRDATGATYAIGEITLDVTDLKRAQTDAEASTRAKTEFLANMSHEIRTPMNAILGMSHLALHSGLNAKQQNYVHKVERSARSLFGLINDILDFSKIQAGALDVESVSFRLGEVLDEVVNALEPLAKDKHLGLLAVKTPGLPNHLIGDPLRLGQVLAYLGNNAVKFTEAGEIAIGIEPVERTADGVVLAFSVRDTGIGMTAEVQERLFRPFNQGDGSSSRRHGGSGLGLAISRHLVQRMGGEFAVTSAPGEGSTFRFTARFGLPQPSVAAASTASAGAPSDARVLVIDDNVIARRALVEMTRAQGLSVDEASDGLEALKAVAQAAQAGRPFDLAVVDWQMPGIDGVEVVRRLGTSAGGRRPGVLMTTAFGRDELIQRLAAVHLHVDDVLDKPVSPTTLHHVYARLFGWAARGDARTATEATGAPANIGVADRERVRGTRILLVEDNPINQELALELLSDAGVVVTLAADGRSALERLAEQPFDAVLMDCQMPVMDGYQATIEIRRDARWRTLPVIAMTANVASSDRARALQVGMNDHIPKPVDVDTMFAVIARWLPRAAPPSRSEPSLVELLDGIPGLDVRAGLKSLMGNDKLYRRLLLKFRNANATFEAQFRAARALGDADGACRLVHDLQSGAGTLGMESIHIVGHRLEQACRHLADEAALTPLLRQLSDGLAPVLAGLRSLDNSTIVH